MLGRWVTSSPPRPSRSSTLRTASCRAPRRSAVTQPFHQGLEGKFVAPGAKTGDDAERDIGQEGLPPGLFAGKDVREMDLDERNPHGEQSVAECETGM